MKEYRNRRILEIYQWFSEFHQETSSTGYEFYSYVREMVIPTLLISSKSQDIAQREIARFLPDIRSAQDLDALSEDSKLSIMCFIDTFSFRGVRGMNENALKASMENFKGIMEFDFNDLLH